MKRYYSVSFYYYVPAKIHGEKKENDLLIVAENKVEKILKRSGIMFKHQYAFPDGSLFKYIISNLSATELQSKLEILFTSRELSVDHIRECDKNEKPYKYKLVGKSLVELSTLEEYLTDLPIGS